PRKYDPATMGDIPGLQVVVVDIADTGHYVVNNQAMETAALYTTIADYLAEGACLFALRPAGGAPYGQYVQVIDAVSFALGKLRNQQALTQYGRDYDELGFAQRRGINEQFPLMIIDEPVYYRAGE
ncbi:MAG: hypothetical protein KDC12_15525, partial [Flavobacteriales bacterium]|nr:hypothetical protein [Flavobacteriales bacterium]